MSTGDTRNDPFPFTVAEANKIIQFPTVARFMRRRYKIDKSYDIPYLAGYSLDGETIFIDRDLGIWTYLGKQWSTDWFLTLHELVEKSIIDAIREEGDDKQRQRLLILLRMTGPDDQIYFHCHGVATAVEEYAVKMQHGESGLKSYNDFMATQVKRAESERIKRVPRVLDTTPYQGNDRQDVHLRAVMHAALAA